MGQPKNEGNIGEDDMKTESTALKKEAPPRPPPPKLFPDGDTPYKGDTPLSGDNDNESISEVKMPRRNPKMYQLVAMESESSSFWWDSVDSSVNLNDDHLEDADQAIAEGVDAVTKSPPPAPSSTLSNSSMNDNGDKDEKKCDSVTSSFAYRVEQKVPAKFSDTCSVRADGLCIGCPKLVGSSKAGNSNMQELFCSTLCKCNNSLCYGLEKPEKAVQLR